jgi:hypothetical protein
MNCVLQKYGIDLANGCLLVLYCLCLSSYCLCIVSVCLPSAHVLLLSIHRSLCSLILYYSVLKHCAHTSCCLHVIAFAVCPRIVSVLSLYACHVCPRIVSVCLSCLSSYCLCIVSVCPRIVSVFSMNIHNQKIGVPFRPLFLWASCMLFRHLWYIHILGPLGPPFLVSLLGQSI